MHIPDLEIDFPIVFSTSALPKKKWYRSFPRFGGKEITGAHQAKRQPNSSLLKQRHKGTIATEVYQSDVDVDKAVDEVLNEPKAEQEESRSKQSSPSTQSKTSSTKVTIFLNQIILKFVLL
ncbi:hypothetical protein SO802_009839 [Lithocarpus litseifolius]|uniref:Uncharacterized protein n=1 Tax=Lithocarpus litseifolius TaxID=425828 RepID=A0AAW2DD31_9ROSI